MSTRSAHLAGAAALAAAARRLLPRHHRLRRRRRQQRLGRGRRPARRRRGRRRGGRWQPRDYFDLPSDPVDVSSLTGKTVYYVPLTAQVSVFQLYG